MHPWEGVVDIPEGKVGTYKIEHFKAPRGLIPRSNIRTAMLGGQNEPPLTFDRETKWHRLTYEGGTWMTDLPIEQIQHDRELEPILADGGTVLMGGLGLGYAASVVAACPRVSRLVVVEISPEVIELVGRHVKDPRGVIQIVNADLFDYLKSNREQFDFGFYDIWQADSVNTLLKTVVPLRLLSGDLIAEVICWNENVMRGQLVFSLLYDCTRLSVSPEHARLPGATLDELAQLKNDVHWDWRVPFYAALKEGRLDRDDLTEYAGYYASIYGMHAWEQWWERKLKGLV